MSAKCQRCFSEWGLNLLLFVNVSTRTVGTLPTCSRRYTDGSFDKDDPHGKTRGQGQLLGFATFLCGVLVGNQQYRTNLNSIFENSLLDDGYDFVEGKLPATGNPETSEPRAMESISGNGSSAESLCGANLGFCRFFLAILWRCCGCERTEKASRDVGHFLHRGEERVFV
jgi:hypothetical protein